MKRSAGILLALVAAVVLGGCAGIPQKPIAVDPTFWQDRSAVIGVASEKLPEADAEMMGQQGLLDVAINRGNAGKMIEQLKKLNLERAAAISDNLSTALTRRGFKVHKLPTLDVAKLPEFKAEANPELYAAHDFRGLASNGIDRLLVVTVEKVGTTRTYYGFMPTGAPRALFAARGQLVDLKTNKLIWYDRQHSTAPVADPWDQEPDFPNVSSAVLKNMADGAGQLERSLFASPAAASGDKPK